MSPATFDALHPRSQDGRFRKKSEQAEPPGLDQTDLTGEEVSARAETLADRYGIDLDDVAADIHDAANETTSFASFNVHQGLCLSAREIIAGARRPDRWFVFGVGGSIGEQEFGSAVTDRFPHNGDEDILASEIIHRAWVIEDADRPRRAAARAAELERRRREQPVVPVREARPEPEMADWEKELFGLI